jgi:Uma2 family endonuclease
MLMNLGIQSPPRTIMEVYKTLPEGTLAELIDNTIYMSPSPIGKHQKTLQNLFRKLSEAIEDKKLGELYIAPYDVYLDENSNAVQPDLILVLKANEKIIEPKGHIHGVPDLLVEILSEGNKEYDLIKKKDLYERFGVKEYWIVDPDTRLALCYQLKDKKYFKCGEEIGIIKSPLLNMEIKFQ